MIYLGFFGKQNVSSVTFCSANIFLWTFFNRMLSFSRRDGRVGNVVWLNYSFVYWFWLLRIQHAIKHIYNTYIYIYTYISEIALATFEPGQLLKRLSSLLQKVLQSYSFSLKYYCFWKTKTESRLERQLKIG